MPEHKHEYKIEGAFLHTRIICVDKTTMPDEDTLKNLGIDSSPDEAWFPIVIDLRAIVAVRKTGYDDGTEVVLYSQCDSWAVDADYDHVVRAWIHQRNILIVR